MAGLVLVLGLAGAGVAWSIWYFSEAQRQRRLLRAECKPWRTRSATTWCSVQGNIPREPAEDGICSRTSSRM